MIIKEYFALDTCGRNRTFVECSCSVCNSIFTKQKRQLNEWMTCSIGCTRIAKGDTLECTCDHCGADFLRSKSKVAASRSGKIFCNRVCKEAAQKYMVEIQPDHYGTGTGESGYRLLALSIYGYVCQKCGYSANKAAIEVHHKDHNRENNLIENLEVLCANCHAIHHNTRG